MNDQERDMLLARLDERTKVIKESIERIIEHQEDQNGYLGAAIADIRSNTTSISWIKKIGGTCVTILLALAGFIISHIIRN